MAVRAWVTEAGVPSLALTLLCSYIPGVQEQACGIDFPRGLAQSLGVSHAGLILIRSQSRLAQAFRRAAGGNELRATSAVLGVHTAGLRQSHVMGTFSVTVPDWVILC